MDQKQVINDIDRIARIDADVEIAVARFGYPLPRIRAQGFETFFSTIVGQQISVEAAAAIMNRVRGFTLLELMMVVAIVGILFAIALPSYRSYTQRSHRADGQSMLVDISAREERFLAQNNTYTTDVTSAAGLSLGTATSPRGYYTLTVAAGACGCISTGDDPRWSWIRKPLEIRVQCPSPHLT